MQLIRVQSWPVFSWGEIFFLSTYIIIKNPTRGRVNVTLIEVALKEQDCYDNSLLEHKVFVLCIFSFEAFYKQLFLGIPSGETPASTEGKIDPNKRNNTSNFFMSFESRYNDE